MRNDRRPRANNRFHSEQSSQLRRKPQPIVSMIKRSASSPNETNISKSQTIGSTIKRSYDRSSQRSHDRFSTKRLSRNLKRLSPEGRRGPSPKRGICRRLLRLGGFSHRRRRSARSTHPPDQLTRRKHRASGAAHAVERMQPGGARAELLSYRTGGLEGHE